MRFYQNLFGPIEDAYGRWFVRICTILMVNLVLSMTLFMVELENARASSQYQGPSGFWYGYTLIGMTLGALALGVWVSRWLIRIDKVLFLLTVAYLFLGQKAQGVRNERFEADYDTSTNGWEYLVMMVMAAAAMRIWALWRRSQREQELAHVLAEARLESEPADAD